MSSQPSSSLVVNIPLIHVPTKTTEPETSRSLVEALQTSGFLLVTSPHVTVQLQQEALSAATNYLEQQELSPEVITHPTDPKVYTMLESPASCPSPKLKEYFQVMQIVKMDILRHLAQGLELDDIDFLVNLHNEHNDALRLIQYLPVSPETGNRCKEHSDYGTITLLSTDGVSGLELFLNGTWHPVPYVAGALVVNIGSLLSGWTRQSLLATLHRVAGPSSLNSASPPDVLREASQSKRTSLAFFADPNPNVSTTFTDSNNDVDAAVNGMSIAEYIAFRSGGSGANRSGVGLTDDEKNRIENDS